MSLDRDPWQDPLVRALCILLLILGLLATLVALVVDHALTHR